MKALVIVIALGATLFFSATAQATTVRISLKGVTGPAVSASTVLIIAEAQNRHVGGNWTATQVKVARIYVKSSSIGCRYPYIATVLQRYVNNPPSGSHAGKLAFIGASPATVLIIAEAQNGHIGGNWTAAQIKIARAYEQRNPFRNLYPRVSPLLEDYLGSSNLGTHSGYLAFTGVSPLLCALGLLLMGSGLLLRRRCPT